MNGALLYGKVGVISVTQRSIPVEGVLFLWSGTGYSAWYCRKTGALVFSTIDCAYVPLLAFLSI